MDGWMDGWMDGEMDGWMDGWINDTRTRKHRRMDWGPAVITSFLCLGACSFFCSGEGLSGEGRVDGRSRD
ncbi:hypothetical protein BZA05DRAFT_403341, partial [Tricharina praecox]|uniref:uncharacterized protein n=1 Tax=Tricharina praecox TaxID=43433 RepID=UPI00221FE7D6